MDDALCRKLIEKIPLADHDRVALFSAGYPASTRDLAAKVTQVDVFDVDFAALRQLTLKLGGTANVHISDDPFPGPQPMFTKALIISPKGRDYARVLLWHAYRSLIEGGQLYLVGGNAEGAKSLIADAGVLFSTAHTLAHKSSHRLGAAHKAASGAAYPAEWGDPPDKPQVRVLETPLGTVRVSTLPGVFSWQALDDGTAFLLEQAEIQAWAQDADLLDMGCGTGVIGCALGRTARSTHLVDVNLLAVRCARTSVMLNGVAHASVVASDAYSEVSGGPFDLILSNPPFHQGFDVSQDVTARIIAGARDHLKPGGKLALVANAFLPYEPLIQQALGQVRVLAQSPRYKVLVGGRS